MVFLSLCIVTDSSITMITISCLMGWLFQLSSSFQDVVVITRTHHRNNINNRPPKRNRRGGINYDHSTSNPSNLFRSMDFFTSSPSSSSVQQRSLRFDSKLFTRQDDINVEEMDESTIMISSTGLSSSSSSPSSSSSNIGLYIHIPYCRQRCRYCDFAIVPIGNQVNVENAYGRDSNHNDMKNNDDSDDNLPQQQQPPPQEQQTVLSSAERGFRKLNDRYIDAIVDEINLIATTAQHTRTMKEASITRTTAATTTTIGDVDDDTGTNSRTIIPNGSDVTISTTKRIPLTSIYFGGGTPSLAPVESIQRMLYHVCDPNNPNAPFTREQQQQQVVNNDGGTTTTRRSGADHNILNGVEITMEMDPGTFDVCKLQQLKRLGINRISLGVQSFDDTILRTMGRFHRSSDIYDAIDVIGKVYGNGRNVNGLEENDIDDCTITSTTKNKNDAINYSIDLISGAPGLTLAKWVATLQEATTLIPQPSHISIYDLQIEKGTVFSRWAAASKVADRGTTLGSVPPPGGGSSSGGVQHFLLPSEEECAFMYKFAAGYLRAKSYEHYEVSSYALYCPHEDNSSSSNNNNDMNDERIATTAVHQSSMTSTSLMPSRRSRHNQIYWDYSSTWYALGLGATSFVDRTLIARPRRMDDYLKWVKDRTNKCYSNDENHSSGEGEEKEEEVDPDEFLTDILLKRLRTTDGLDLNWLEQNYGQASREAVLRGATLGLELDLAELVGNTLRLKDPNGLLYSNYIISSIYVELGYEGKD